MQWFIYVYAPHHKGLLLASGIAALCVAGLLSLLFELRSGSNKKGG